MNPFSRIDVVFAAQTACLLEVSVDKPGNVGPSHDFIDTKYEDFLSSGFAIGEVVRDAVEFGMTYKPETSGVGFLIKKGVLDSSKGHEGRNTNLGMLMLLIPLSVSCGLLIKNNKYTLKALREGVSSVIKGSTPIDTVELYDAISTSDAEVGRSKRFDVKDPLSKKRVQEKNLNLFDVFNISKWDNISRELVTGMEITFETGYPALASTYRETGNMKKSVLRSFFDILSKYPDTLIERKNDRHTAESISLEAKEILENGLQIEEVATFDSKLRQNGNKLNPGTTADITASSIMVGLLDGLLF